MALDPVDLSLLPQGQPNYSFTHNLRQGLTGFAGNTDLAMALLANSGYGPKRSFGQVLGQSGLQAQQMGQQRQDDEFKRQYMQAQMAAMQGKQQRKPIAVLDKDGKPVLVDEQDAIGMQPYAGGSDAKPSALIQAFNLATTQGFKGSLLEFQEQLAKASAQYPYQVGDVGGVPNLIPRVSPNVPVQPQAPGAIPAPFSVRPVSTLDNEIKGKGALAQAGAAGATTGEKTAAAQFDLPRVESNIDQALGDIQKLKVHPGLGNITGLYSKAPIIPGTNQAAADALAKQVQGQTFLQAYNALKGAGAITETEGAKAEASVARLARAQSTDDYRAALDDLSAVLKNGKERLRKQAGGAAATNDKDPLGIR